MPIITTLCSCNSKEDFLVGDAQALVVGGIPQFVSMGPDLHIFMAFKYCIPPHNGITAPT